MLEVAFVSANGPLAPGFRVRGTLLADSLRQESVELTAYPLFDERQAIRFARGGAAVRAATALEGRRALRRRLIAPGRTDSVALIYRQADLLPSLTLERIAIGDRRLVYDVDDAIWNDYRGAHGHPLAVLKGSARKLRWLAGRADHVIAATPILADRLARHARRVSVIPSLVDPSSVPPRAHAQRDELVLGWIGSPTTAPYLEDATSLLRLFAARRRDRVVKLLVVGGAVKATDGLNVVSVRWSPERERRALAEMDVGLMPMPDNPWTRGKAAYKALQYMAAAVPVIADPVGVTRETVGDGAGLFPANAQEWVEGLETLAASAELRQRLGDAGRERVEEHYSPRRWIPSLAAILRGD
jgi:glycosyltransferase involved in cell wall biosynthesis